MKKIFLVLFLTFYALTIAAQEDAAAKSKTNLRKKYYVANMSVLMWQEKIDATNASGEGEMRFQFQGIRLGGALVKPFQKKFRWLQYYGAELAFGQATGKGTTTTFNSELEDQLWLSGTVNPGIMYRTTALSDIGFMLPLSFRTVSWAKDENTMLTVDRESTISLGMTLAFVTRFSLKSSMLISVTHHHMWDSTVWALGWQHDFK